MKIVCSIILCFFISPHTIFAQTRRLDSLKNEVTLLRQRPASYSNDTNLVKTLNATVWMMANFPEKLDSALNFAEEAVTLAEKVNWTKGKIDAYSGKGKVLRNQNSHEEALKNYLQTATLAKEINNNDWTATALYFAGQILYDQGDYPAALDYFLQALHLNEATGNKADIARDLTFIGKLYAAIDDNSNALNNHLQALKIYEEQNNKIWTAINLMDIASIYKIDNEFAKAIEYYNRVLDLQKGNIYSSFRVYIDLGHVYNRQSDQPDSLWGKAMEFYSMGLKTATELQDGYAIASALHGMGWLYLKKNMLEEADTAFNRSLKYLLDEKDPEGLRDCYLGMSKLDSIRGNWKSSLHYFKLYSTINDSLFNRSKSHELTRLQIKHVTDKKQEEIVVLNKENELKDLRIQQQRTNILLVIAAAIILLLGLGGFIFYRNRKLKQQALKQVGEAKLASLKSLMDKHFIFSSLHSIDTFLMNHDAEAASDYLVKFSKLIRQILEMSNQVEVALEAEVSLCKSYLDLEKIRFNYSFDYEFSIDKTISPQEAQFPSMLLQPLVENAVKHGVGSLQGDREIKGLIRITINKVKDQLVCTVSDNGKGLGTASTKPESHRSYSGKGILERVRVYNTLLKNQASFDLKDNYPGVAAVLTLPYITMKKRMAV